MAMCAKQMGNPVEQRRFLADWKASKERGEKDYRCCSICGHCQFKTGNKLHCLKIQGSTQSGAICKHFFISQSGC